MILGTKQNKNKITIKSKPPALITQRGVAARSYCSRYRVSSIYAAPPLPRPSDATCHGTHDSSFYENPHHTPNRQVPNAAFTPEDVCFPDSNATDDAGNRMEVEFGVESEHEGGGSHCHLDTHVHIQFVYVRAQRSTRSISLMIYILPSTQHPAHSSN